MNFAGARAAEFSSPSVEELRGAERFALLIRTAKLVCDGGEFFCVVRDISASGIRLKLFHALPGDPRALLELANGASYTVEKVWERQGEAGFRFTGTIDVPRFIEERSRWPRRPMRLRLAVPALITADGVAVPAALSDLSQQGAKIEVDRFLALQQKVKLDVRGLPPIVGNVCWRASPSYGLVFQQRFTFDELARMAAGLQLGQEDGGAGATPGGKSLHRR